MDRFGRCCKGPRALRDNYAVDDAFSAHMRGPLTGFAVEGKLGAFL